ncbi:gametocyte-specific factor 1 isoform X1 [Fundulus heteroclitus]|uniref:gametocyte-specific factor 1 isoform X1 n=2 Tax=Fundulus heteroclitus TaxID=8078 RepID=UPI00165A6766|nr:gametocyte-specific factor 1 isoform X1 [Fundulus heteroclitus]XP_021178713.2 gametocyte-specific factor 1 isoform X1 [Fundulus heteroclitus]
MAELPHQRVGALPTSESAALNQRLVAPPLDTTETVALMSAPIRFGTRTGPYSMPSEDEAQTVEIYDSKGNCDPDKLLQCPFDKNHQIRSCRFPYHLIKCRKNHPELASRLKTCPFNARHLVPKHELAHHTENCEDRISVDPEDAGSHSGHGDWHVPVNTWVNPNMSEDWDKEADDGQAPFVWGVNSKLSQIQATRPSNHLGPNFRVPSTVPWSNDQL